MAISNEVNRPIADEVNHLAGVALKIINNVMFVSSITIQLGRNLSITIRLR